MKVKISNYPNPLVCNIHTRHMEKKYAHIRRDINWSGNDHEDHVLEAIEDGVQRVYDVFNWLWFNRRTQKIKVRIDPWDTWSMDYSLAHIILPMLKQLKENNHGYPATLTEKSWNDIMDKMIYAFECKVLDGDLFDTGNQKKMQEGFRLFGKYYQNLWD